MTEKEASATTFRLLLVTLLLLLCVPRTLVAHCDTMDGPVVTDAKAALQKGDVGPVLKWVKAEHEGEVREAFARTLEVRKSGAVALDLADRYFFETLVRIHREGEAEPYFGLKPSGTDPGVGIGEADRALHKNSADDLVRSMTAQMTKGINERYTRTVEKRKHAEESVQAGREYVEAYVEFIHYVERLQEIVTEIAGEHAAHGVGEQDPAPPHR